eukprot:CAMPEP_0197875980 /NCGR_PEP_ID=MMETSP1439-20131203/5097_1 /TAXON_ID=66791 /ORGANISM="Gonyaulax spinifera, Strain CCMP409" /LENGTH=149 /DNA_ID=CAMNT_0043495239 /DNA_START=58 /DNA_END=507 /DNA_ORIENTATION=-
MTVTGFNILEPVTVPTGVQVIQISRGMYHLLDLVSTIILFLLPFFFLDGMAFMVTLSATVLHNISHAVTDFGDTTPWLPLSTAKQLPLKLHVIVDLLYGMVVFWIAWVLEAPGDSKAIGQQVYQVLSLLIFLSTPLLVARLFEKDVSIR